jgi:hypothetical protein
MVGHGRAQASRRPSQSRDYLTTGLDRLNRREPHGPPRERMLAGRPPVSHGWDQARRRARLQSGTPGGPLRAIRRCIEPSPDVSGCRNIETRPAAMLVSPSLRTPHRQLPKLIARVRFSSPAPVFPQVRDLRGECQTTPLRTGAEPLRARRRRRAIPHRLPRNPRRRRHPWHIPSHPDLGCAARPGNSDPLPGTRGTAHLSDPLLAPPPSWRRRQNPSHVSPLRITRSPSQPADCQLTGLQSVYVRLCRQ